MLEYLENLLGKEIFIKRKTTVNLFFSWLAFCLWNLTVKSALRKFRHGRLFNKGSNFSLWVACTQSTLCHYVCDTVTAVCVLYYRKILALYIIPHLDVNICRLKSMKMKLHEKRWPRKKQVYSFQMLLLFYFY